MAAGALTANSAELWVSSGVYTDTGAAVVTLRRGVQLYGGFSGTETLRGQRDRAANATVIDGEGARRCVLGADAAALDGFTVTRGYASDNGGGMYNTSCSPTVTNCTFTGNAAGVWGGAMYNQSCSSAIVTNCTFTDNSAGRGGGMFNYSCSSPTVTNCAFIHCSAVYDGGGMYNQSSSSPTLTNCTFTGNSVSTWGGGMVNLSSSPTLTNCTFTGNLANHAGGGIHNDGSSPVLTNCTFTGNTGTDQGGGVFSYYSSMTLTNCILWGDVAPTGSEIHTCCGAAPLESPAATPEAGTATGAATEKTRWPPTRIAAADASPAIGWLRIDTFAQTTMGSLQISLGPLGHRTGRVNPGKDVLALPLCLFTRSQRGSSSAGSCPQAGVVAARLATPNHQRNGA